ncbi:MAG: hypothetical protein KGI08_08430, partial [Thaumarchaeota archaeon]|nr:hypothetical protein [Nitrososphaerota archaeon]
NSTISGNLTQVKGDGSTTHQIIRNAFDNYFGNWSIDYTYNGVKQIVNFKVTPIVLTIFTDKYLYYEPDIMKINITTSYYVPVAAHAEFIHLNFYDQKGKLLNDIIPIDIRAFQPNVIYNFAMGGLAHYHPPGLYKLKVQYYNTIVEIPFLLGEYSTLMQVSSQTDKNTYQVGDAVNMELLITRVTQSNGTLKITDPLGDVTVHQFHVNSVHTSLILDDMTKHIGTYSYVVQYAGISNSGSFNVIANPTPLPNIELDVSPDKLNYRPGEIIHVKIHISQIITNSTSLWVVDPNGVEYPRLSLPITTTDTILPHKISKNYMTGQWTLYIDYDRIIRDVPFYVKGSPVNDNDILNINQFSVPTFVSNFGATSFNAPTGIAIDSDNDVYVVDSGNSQVKKFDSEGKLLLSWGTVGSENGQFIHPNGIFVGKKYVYVADTGNARIQMFDKEGNFIYGWGSYGDAHGMLHTPVGLATDSSGDLFVADSGRNTIQIFNTQDVYANEIKSLLTEGANFTSLNGIAFDSNDYFYVSSSDNKILKFSDIGDFINFFGSNGTENSRFINPTAIAIDSKDNFYVADTNNHRIQKFDPYGNFILSWGSEGTSTGQFEEPVGLATDSLGNIYIVDKKNDNIQKFSLYGISSKTVPNWVRERALWWSEGALGKDDFALVVKFMINQGLIDATAMNETSSIHVPQWVKKEANWWALGQIDDESFANSLQYLISIGILKV